MSVLFLDIDGVLNSERWYVRRMGLDPDAPVPAVLPVYVRRSRLDEIDPEAVKLLNRIIDETGCKIVVSSTWRFFGAEWIAGFLCGCGVVGEVIGVTPRLNSIRGIEIGEWLTAHPEVQRFVILDDDSDMGTFASHLIQTKFRDGLTAEIADRCIERLKGEA